MDGIGKVVFEMSHLIYEKSFDLPYGLKQSVRFTHIYLKHIPRFAQNLKVKLWIYFPVKHCSLSVFVYVLFFSE